MTKIAVSGTRITRSSAAAEAGASPSSTITKKNPYPNSTAATLMPPRKKTKAAAESNPSSSSAEPVTAEDDLEAAVAAGVAKLVQEDVDEVFNSPRAKSFEARGIAELAYFCDIEEYTRMVRADLSPSRKTEIVVKPAYDFLGVIFDDIARVKYSSTLTIGELKTILKPYPWIPEKKLVLIKDGSTTPLCTTDDRATLGECGIVAMDTILACMDGPFTFIIYDVNTSPANWRIDMKSCLQSVGDLKVRMSQLRGYCVGDIVLTQSCGSPPLEDNTLLVTVGVVKPYMKAMRRSCHILKLKKIHGLQRERKLAAAAAADIAATSVRSRRCRC